MKTKIFLFIIAGFLSCGLHAQLLSKANIVSGRVIASGEEEYLAGATVRALNNNTAVRADESGAFSITLGRLPDTLQVSHTGFRTQKVVILTYRGGVMITLVPITSTLETVVVNTGYQRMKPNEVNGAVTIVDAKTLGQQTSPNLLDRLKGVTSGVSFNDGYSNNNTQNKTGFSVRGLSTINGPLDPLIVLDNFIYEGDIDNINPNDIESITVLKDAAAASIWGARAGNGVIVITTKKGRFNQKLRVDFSSITTFTQKPAITKLPEISSGDYIDLEQFLFNNGYFNSTISRGYSPLTPAVEIFLNRRNGLISAPDSAQQIDKLKSIDARQQYSKYLYRPAFTQQYGLNLRGGSENLAWIVAGSYNINKDNLGASYEKMNFRFSNTYKPVKNLLVNLDVFYTASKSATGKYMYGTVSAIGGRHVPYLQFADENGTALPVTNGFSNAYIDTAGGGKLLDWKYYPLDDYKHNSGTTRLDEVVANAGLQYQVFKPLSLSLQYQYQQQRSNASYNSDIESYNARSLINLFSQVNRSTGVVSYIVPPGGILQLANSTISSQNTRGQLDFLQRWGNHSVSIIAGAEVREVSTNGDGTKFYGYNEDPLSYANVDYVTRYPTIVTGGYQAIPGGSSLSATVNRFVSVYANASYNFMQRYTLSASARKDGSNIFGVTTNDKWKPLWSAGLGWDVSKESFYHIAWMPYLKLRTSYGYSGNVDLSKSALPLAGYGNDFITNLPDAVINTINNPGLKWEQTGQYNIGIDVRTKGGRIAGSIDYYCKKGTNLYGQTPYDYTTWGRQNTLVKNVADMKGSGVDVMVSTKNMDRTFKWYTSVLYNYNTSKTTAYYDDASKNLTSLFSSGRSISPVIGKPLYALAAYKWAGLDSHGNPQGYLDKQISTDYSAMYSEALNNGLAEGNVRYIGSAIPTSFGSVINTFSWKALQVSVNISYKLGYYFVKPSLSYSGLVSQGGGNKEYAHRWQNPGDEAITNVPSFVYPVDSKRDAFYLESDINILKGDHLRLQYIDISYQLPGNNKPFKEVRFFFNAANLGILWRANKLNIDPDYPGGIPLPASFSFGANLNF